MDKIFWQEIVSSDCKLPGNYNAADLLPDLLAFLASRDAELRDEVAYIVFARWILRDTHFSADELRSLIATLTQNLKWQIGERNTDSVLLRSFSALILSLIAYYDLKVAFLDSTEVADLLDSTLKYLNAEQDLRGYVDGVGWHHATAHTADLLKFLCRNPNTSAAQHERVMDAIFDRLSAPTDCVYIYDEDERLTLVILEIVRRGTVTQNFWNTWLLRFTEWKTNKIQPVGFVTTIHAPYMNCKNLLRSLYFTLQAESEGKTQKNGSELASELVPLVLRAVRSFGTGTIYVDE